MTEIRRAILCICGVLLLFGCATPKSLVVLLPNPDGKTGSIEVSNEEGVQTISEAHRTITIESKTAAPSPPVAMNESEITSIFGAAFSAQPPAPAHFLLYFKRDSVELTDISLMNLEIMYSMLERGKPVEITVIGHTDRVGSRERNFRLGMERADQIRNMLIGKGIDANIIQVNSHGEDNPLFKTDDEVHHPENRRVEIVIR